MDRIKVANPQTLKREDYLESSGKVQYNHKGPYT